MSAVQHLRARLAALPRGVLSVGIGLGVLGATSYGFLLIAARALPPGEFTEVTVVWTVLFTIGPGLFLPIEQELGRHISATRSSRDLAADRTSWRLVTLSGALLALVTALAALAWPWLGEPLFNGELLLFIMTIAATACLWPIHCARGLLAGSGRFGRYALQLGIDGGLRVVGAAALWYFGANHAWQYAAVFVVSQLVALICSIAGVRFAHTASTGPGLPWSALARALGWTLVAVLASQLLINGGTFAVKALTPSGNTTAGIFLTALVVARVPLFLFSALQASMIPSIARMLAESDFRGVKSLTRRVLHILLLLGGVATVVLGVIGPVLLRFIFGPTFVISRGLLILLALGCTAYMLAAALAQVTLAAARPRAAGVIWSISVVTFVLLLLPPTELTARVSWALLIAAVVALGLFAWEMNRIGRLVRGHHLRIDPHGSQDAGERHREGEDP